MNQTTMQAQMGLAADPIPSSILALAMGYVPAQAFGELYEPSLALSRGTIFPGLDQPFLGEEVTPRE